VKTLSSSLFTCGSTEGPLAGSSNIHNVSLQTYTMYLSVDYHCTHVYSKVQQFVSATSIISERKFDGKSD